MHCDGAFGRGQRPSNAPGGLVGRFTVAPRSRFCSRCLYSSRATKRAVHFSTRFSNASKCMGLLRTLLALSVVFDHAWPDGAVLVGGQIAVQCFYIMSGFLISYILVERRSYASTSAFYINRYLRLYPIYFVVAILSLIAILATHRTGFAKVYETAPAGAIVLLVFANTFLFGMDWVLFCGVQNHRLVFVKNFLNSDVPLWQGQVI